MIYDMLYPYQKVGAEAIANQRRKSIFDEPGLGKTLTVLGGVELAGGFERGSKTLVLATRTGAALTWLPHADQYLPDGVLVIDGVRKTLPERRKLASAAMEAPDAAIVVANHDFITLPPTDHSWKDLAMWQQPWDAILIDESHKVLPTTAEDDFNQTRFWRGLSRLKSTEHGIRVAMSGTPDRGKLENRYGTWAFQFPEVYGYKGDAQPYSKWLEETFKLRWEHRYIRVRGRPMEIAVPRVVALKDPQHWYALNDVFTLRRTKAEVAEDLPPKRYVDIELPFSPTQERGYNLFIDTFAKSDDGSKQSAETFIVRATQFAIVEHDVTAVPGPGNRTHGVPKKHGKSPKLEWIIEWLEERGYDDLSTTGKVVITSQFTSVLNWMEEELKDLGYGNVNKLIGGQSTNERLRSQVEFQTPNEEGGAAIMLLSMKLGDSIDLDAADDMIFVDHVHDPDVTQQVEDRVHRVSRNHNVVIWRLITKGSVDEAIARTNSRRFTTTRTHLDGRRGVDFARKVLARYAA